MEDKEYPKDPLAPYINTNGTAFNGNVGAILVALLIVAAFAVVSVAGALA